MLLNAFDLETSSGTRNLELRAGAFAGLGIEADLLAVSSEGLTDDSAPNRNLIMGLRHLKTPCPIWHN